MGTVVYIGLGSNLAEPIKQVLQAVEDIKKLELSAVDQVSSL